MLALQGIPTSCEASPPSATGPVPDRLRFSPGLLVEISGPGAREEAARFLARHPGAAAAWIEQSLEPFPEEVRRVRLNWDRVLFVHGGKDSAWSLAAFLSSHLFPLVVYYAPYGNERMLRRVRKMARAAGAMVLLLSEESLPLWQVHYQYRTHGGRLELLRGRKA